MGTVAKKLYEAMFLVDSSETASDWDGVLTTITTILEKAKAEVVTIRKWQECRLAYEVNHKARGTYILSYFKADGEKIRQIERDVQLSQRIMRVLILNAEHMSEEEIKEETSAIEAEESPESAAPKEVDQAQPAAEEPKGQESIETVAVGSDEAEPVDQAEEKESTAQPEPGPQEADIETGS